MEVTTCNKGGKCVLDILSSAGWDSLRTAKCVKVIESGPCVDTDRVNSLLSLSAKS